MERDLSVRLVIDHADTEDGYHEWVHLGERVRANRLGISNRRMWDKRWTKWVCNSPACPAWALVSDDGVRRLLDSASRLSTLGAGGPSVTDLLLFHWSPSERRKSIARRGLVPGSESTDRLWKPPYVCFADSPSLAWALSGMTGRGSEHALWDLWMVWASALDGYETLPFDDEDRVKEYRVYKRIPKRDLWFVGSRGLDGERAEVR